MATRTDWTHQPSAPVARGPPAVTILNAGLGLAAALCLSGPASEIRLSRGHISMKRLLLAVATLALAGITGEARADLGSYDQYGYQAPGKYTKSKASDSKPLFSFGKSKKAKAAESDGAFQVKSKKKKSAKADDEDAKPAKGPAELSGGPRPSIAPVAPPKVSFPNGYGAGSIVIDTNGRKLYYVLSSSQAYRYPISVGREGFTWTGTQKISREVDWPDWRPPAEMLERKPNLPELMTGGIRNPLGVKALYLGNTLYRIHGTNDAKSIGYAASSGCFRMLNGHVVHLAAIAGIGTTVRVLSKLPSSMANAQ